MPTPPDVNLWSSTQHATEYLDRADSIPHRAEGEATLLEFVPSVVNRVLDIGVGDGRLLAAIKARRPTAEFVGIDFSPTMLEASRKRFREESRVAIIAHDFAEQLPPIGQFDCIVSSFAIHHVSHQRKKALYAEVFQLLTPVGVFCNLEHVDSPSTALHHQFLKKLNSLPEQEDPSNKLLDVKTQLDWLREIGFIDVDCHWKWRELALLAGVNRFERFSNLLK